MARISERKPAETVKCPHCSWNGSARGLFGHIRLTHPGKEKNAITKAINPNSVIKSRIGHIPSKSKKSETIEDIGLQILFISIVKMINDYFEKTNKVQQFQSRGHKSNTQGV